MRNRDIDDRLMSPIVGRCGVLCKEILRVTTKTPNYIKHPFVDELKKDSAMLYKYAIRQLNGKDYRKRATDLIEEIRAQIYLLRALNGLSDYDAMLLDVACEEVIKSLFPDTKGQNVEDEV